LAQAIEACVLARIEETEPAAVDVARINRWAAVLSFPQLQPTARIVWQAPRPVEGALARITRDAVDLWE
jgi:putative stress-induced transcription regulator